MAKSPALSKEVVARLRKDVVMKGRGNSNVAELAAKLNVSEMTIYRAVRGTGTYRERVGKAAKRAGAKRKPSTRARKAAAK